MDARDDPGSSPDRSPSPKKRSAPKRVVSVPVLEAEAGLRAKPGSDAAPPPDSWAWRKYGQKPIKGSPYPRGYYRCSSAKGCPARKQVERSRTDPTQFIITYSSDHNHPWSLPKNHHHQNHHHAAAAPTCKTKAAPADHTSAAIDPEENFSDLIVEEPSLLLHDEFRWPSNSAPEAADDGLLFGPFLGGSVPDDICEYYSGGAAGEEEEEEDGLFAGLGELPEWSVVFRRGFFDRQVRGGDEGMRCGLEADESAAAAAAAAASWCGSTG